MKKIVVFTALIFMLLNNNYAQSSVRFGFQLSPTFSWMSTSDNGIKGDGLNLGLKLGVLGEYTLSERYSIVTGLGLSFNQGGGLNYDQGGVFWPNSANAGELSQDSVRFIGANSTVKYGMQYIEIPAALKLSTRYFGSIKYFAEIPSFNVGIVTTAKGSVNDTEVSKENVKKDILGLNLSWGLGAGAEYEISEGTTILAGLYYNQGFTDTTADDGLFLDADGDPTGEFEDSKATLGTFTIRIGVMF